MWILHVKATVKPGDEAQYERWKITEGEEQCKAPGFIKRTMVRSKDRKGIYFYQSAWETKEQAHEFMSSEHFKELYAKLRPDNTFEVPMERDECELVFDEVAVREQASV